MKISAVSAFDMKLSSLQYTFLTEGEKKKKRSKTELEGEMHNSRNTSLVLDEKFPLKKEIFLEVTLFSNL